MSRGVDTFRSSGCLRSDESHPELPRRLLQSGPELIGGREFDSPFSRRAVYAARRWQKPSEYLSRSYPHREESGPTAAFSKSPGIAVHRPCGSSSTIPILAEASESR